MLWTFILCFLATLQLSSSLAMSGQGYSIYHPFNITQNHGNHHGALLGSPEHFIKHYEVDVKMLSRYVDAGNLLNDPLAYSRELYFEVLKQFLSGGIFKEKELSVQPRLTANKLKAKPLTSKFDRAVGVDWTGFGTTMAGEARLRSAASILVDVFKNKIEGAIVETGVWRGGMSIFLRAVVRAYNEGDRLSFVCDSFNGLPPSSYRQEDKSWDGVPYLEVSDKIVIHNFEKMGLADPNVVFVKGFFSATMKPLSDLYQGKFALLRLDGDMYESTVDVLYSLYGRLSLGGYVIMDDWFGFQSKLACEQFFAVHNIEPEIFPVDSTSIYWKKTEEVQIQYWRYEQKKFEISEVEN